MQDQVLFNALFGKYLENKKAIGAITIPVRDEVTRIAIRDALEYKRLKFVKGNMIKDVFSRCSFNSCPGTDHESVIVECKGCHKHFCHRHAVIITEVRADGLSEGYCPSCLPAQNTSRETYTLRYLITEAEQGTLGGLVSMHAGRRLSNSILLPDFLKKHLSTPNDAATLLQLLDGDAGKQSIDFLRDLELASMLQNSAAQYEEQALTTHPVHIEPFDIIGFIDQAIVHSVPDLPHRKFLHDFKAAVATPSFQSICNALPTHAPRHDAWTWNAFGFYRIESIMNGIEKALANGEYIGSNPPVLVQSCDKQNPSLSTACSANLRFIRLLATWESFHATRATDLAIAEIGTKLLEDPETFVTMLGSDHFAPTNPSCSSAPWLARVIESILKVDLGRQSIGITLTPTLKASSVVIEVQLSRSLENTASIEFGSLTIKNSSQRVIREIKLTDLCYYFAFCGYVHVENDTIIVASSPADDCLSETVGDTFSGFKPILQNAIHEMMSTMGEGGYAEFSDRKSLYSATRGKSFLKNDALFSAQVTIADLRAGGAASKVSNLLPDIENLPADQGKLYINAFITNYAFPGLPWKLFRILIGQLTRDILFVNSALAPAVRRTMASDRFISHAMSLLSQIANAKLSPPKPCDVSRASIERAISAGFILYMYHNLLSTNVLFKQYMGTSSTFQANNISVLAITMHDQDAMEIVRECLSTTLLCIVPYLVQLLTTSWNVMMQYD